MKKSFMTRALAMGLSLAMAFSLSAATNVSVASAATAKPAMKSKSISVKVGQTKNYNATDATKKNYAIKNVKLSAEGKKAASVTWTAGKITVTGKAADSTKRNVKITFKNRKTKKNYYVTLKLVVKAAPVEEEKPAVSTAAAITAIKQTSATKLAAEFSADMTGIKYTDLKIVRDETKAEVTVKSATVDKNDNTKVTIETYEALTDGKTYTVTYTAADEAKTESSANFTATAGVVADIALNNYSIPANTPTEIKYQLLDANGVLIEEKGIGKAKSAKVDVSIVNFNGYQNDSEVTLYKVGDEATLKIVYHTWKYNTDGSEDGKVERELKITAVEQSSVIETYEYSVVATKGTVVDFKRDTLKTQIAVGDDADDIPYAKFSFRKADGTDITSTLDYSVSSGNENVLLASGSVAGGAQLTPVAVGATYLVIKNASGNVIKTLPITVVAKRELATMSLNKSSVTISKVDDGKNSQKITVSVMDQHSENYKYFNATNLELKSGNKATQPDVSVGLPYGNKVDVTIKANSGITAAGAYSYTLDLVDTNKTTNVRKVNFTVIVSEKLAIPDSFALVMKKGSTSGDIVSTVDTTVGAGNYYNGIQLRPTIVAKNNGSIVRNATEGAGKDIISIGAITLTKDGAKVDSKWNGIANKVYTANATKYSDLVINVSDGDGTDWDDPIIKYLAPGKYTLSFTAKLKINDKDVLQPMSTTFVVEDSQKTFETKTKAISVTVDNYTNLGQVFEDPDYVTFIYASEPVNQYGYTAYKYVGSKSTAINAKSTNVEKVTMNVKLPGTSVDGTANKVVQMTASVGRTFTFTATPVLAGNVDKALKSFKTNYMKADGTSAITTTSAAVKAIADAKKAIIDFDALSDTDKANMGDTMYKVIVVAEEAAAKVVANAATVSNTDIANALWILEVDYSSDDLALYRKVMTATGFSAGATTTSAITACKQMVTRIAAARSDVDYTYKQVEAAVGAVSGAAVSNAGINAVKATFAISGASVVASASGVNVSAGAVSVSAITGSSVMAGSAPTGTFGFKYTGNPAVGDVISVTYEFVVASNTGGYTGVTLAKTEKYTKTVKYICTAAVPAGGDTWDVYQ